MTAYPDERHHCPCGCGLHFGCWFDQFDYEPRKTADRPTEAEQGETDRG